MSPDVSSLLAAATQTQSKAATAVDLPDRARALDVADFERLLDQARQQQANVEFAPAQDHHIGTTMSGITRAVDAASSEYISAVKDVRQKTMNMDPLDLGSYMRALESVTLASIKSSEMSIMLNEVSGAKKSLNELFHNQG
jgi:hypothetical protein